MICTCQFPYLYMKYIWNIYEIYQIYITCIHIWNIWFPLCSWLVCGVANATIHECLLRIGLQDATGMFFCDGHNQSSLCCFQCCIIQPRWSEMNILMLMVTSYALAHPSFVEHTLWSRRVVVPGVFAPFSSLAATNVPFRWFLDTIPCYMSSD